MAYCTAEDVAGMLKNDMISYIVGDEFIEDEEERMAALLPLAGEAAADAQAEIDGYLAKRYDVPFAHPPAVIGKFAKDIALYNLVSRKGIDEGDREKTYLTRYNAAVAFLTKVAEGKIDIGASGGSAAAVAQNGFSMRSERRTFSRDSMRGW